MKNKPLLALLAFNSKRILRRKMPSGIEGGVCRLRANYANYEEFEACSDTYGIAQRLNFVSNFDAWKKNPLVCFSVNLWDFGRYKGK